MIKKKKKIMKTGNANSLYTKKSTRITNLYLQTVVFWSTKGMDKLITSLRAYTQILKIHELRIEINFPLEFFVIIIASELKISISLLLLFLRL